MRIAMKRNAAASSCEAIASGEVEDYTINVIADIPPTCDVANNLSASNATNNSITVSWSASANASSYDLDYRIAGGTWNTINTASTSYNLSGLISESTYEVKVLTICSFGNSGYSSTISATTSANPTCDVVNGLALNNATNNSLTASWSASTNASSYNLDYRATGGAWSTVNTASTSYNLSGLSAATTYEVKVSTVCSFGNSNYSNTVSATTSAEVAEYCPASGTSTSEWIEAVNIGNIVNVSGSNGGYGDFLSQTTSLELGSTSILTITPGFPYSWLFGYTTQPEFYSVWIDLNQDGDFNDANELRYISPNSTSSYAPFSVNITVPAEAALGETLMRVAMKRSSAANSCGNYSNGEVEDYTINIVSTLNGGARTAAFRTAELKSAVYPNPANQSTIIDLHIPASTGQVKMILMDLSGKVIASNEWASKSESQTIKEKIDVSTIPKGLYFMQITSENGNSQNHKLIVE